MKVIDRDKLVRDFEACLGWPYVTPGGTREDCSVCGIDCSGMFVRAFKLQGASIAHGSNTIWRKHLGSKGKIASEADLQVGMAVFKWNSNDVKGDGLGDFQHIGLVTGVRPLRIVHASTTGMVVRADSSLGKSKTGGTLWKYWGKLNGVSYGGQTVANASADQPTAASDSRSMLRKGSKGAAVVALQTRLRDAGYELEPDGIFGEMTRQAVLSYQASKRLEQDGVVGPMTWAALDA